MKRLEGKAAIITGAGGGLGQAIAEKFVQEGASVYLNDLNEAALKAFADRMNQTVGQGKVAYSAGDIAKKSDVTAMVNGAIAAFGNIDILVNNAGGSLNTPKKLEDIQEEDWDLVLNVNLKGTFLASQAVVEHMKNRKQGKIVNLASLAGRTASVVTGVAYAAAKGGVISFTRRLAKEVGPHGIHVNAVAPGVIISGERIRRLFYEETTASDQQRTLNEIALGTVGQPGDVADAVCFLASEESKYVTGAILDVNGGRFMG